MDIPQLSLENYVALCLIVGTPWAYRNFSHIFHGQATQSKKDATLSLLLLVHTLYMLYKLLVAQPIDVFKILGLTVTAPPQYLRTRLMEEFGASENLPPELDLLVKRLGLSDMRAYYILFGHTALTACSYCQSFEDFALFSLPGTLLEYVREIALVGILTFPMSGTGHLRPLGLGVLLAGFLAEIYWTLTTQVLLQPPSSKTPVIMWHDRFVLIRHTIFLTLPLLITFLPSLGLHRMPILSAFMPVPRQRAEGHAPDPNIHPAAQQATLTQITAMTVQTLNHLIPTLHLVKYTHAAVMRSQSGDDQEGKDSGGSVSLHERATKWWAQEAREGKIVREDEEVRRVLRMSQMGVDSAEGEGGKDGQLLESAKVVVRLLKEQGRRPSDYWAYAPS